MPNPIVPQFPQRVVRSDGSTFIHWTTSPRSVIRLSRDVTSNPLWNVGMISASGVQEESETSGRLGRFNRRFGEVGADQGRDFDWMSEVEPIPEEEKES